MRDLPEAIRVAWGTVAQSREACNSSPLYARSSPSPKGAIMASKEPVRRPSRTLTQEDAAVIKKRLKLGEFQSRIAADFDVNPGRIAEINTGRTFPDVDAAP